MNTLLLAQLIIYIILIQPITYITYRHGLHGLLGWGYLSIFCTLRIVGGGLGFNRDSTVAYIINSVGISPLLLAVDGVLHEAKTYRNPHLHKAFHWAFVIIMHMTVMGAVVVAAKGAAGLAGNNPTSTDTNLLQAGIAILETCWAILVIWALFALLPAQRAKNAPGYKEGSTLLYGSLIALVFIGIRVLYALIADCTQDAKLNPMSGELAIRVVLGLISELVTVLVFIYVGVRTLDVRKYAGVDARKSEDRSVENWA
ncbi:hypothetical protein MW887_006645 [Aspergillus wentii]|nr:hypothetical protein MW887_006645 [Aspergillus wentii]